jgi:post-segregation antitoxin (ccd killing protein)
MAQRCLDLRLRPEEWPFGERMGSGKGCAVAELQVSEVSQRSAVFRGSVRIYASEQCPRQDSNLRSRLRRALPCTALTWPYVLDEVPWGAYGARKRELERAARWRNSVYTMRMARVNITLPDDLLNQARAAGLNVSRLAAAALAEELDRRAKLHELDAYLADLDNELGPVPQHELRAAREWADAILPASRGGVGQARSA